MPFLLFILALLPALYLALHYTFNFGWHWSLAIAHFFNHYTFITFHTHLKHPLTFTHDVLGLSALILLIATLFITPLNSYLKINLIKYRRMLGIMTFFYALAHFLFYFFAIKEANSSALAYAITHKTFISFGFVSFLILLLMALTSNHWLFDKFRSWHKLIYLALITLTLHILLAQKVLHLDIIIYVTLLVALLALRLFKR